MLPGAKTIKSANLLRFIDLIENFYHNNNNASEHFVIFKLCAMWSICIIPNAFVIPVLLLLLLPIPSSVWGTLPFGNRNGESGVSSGGFGGVGGGRRNNPRLPVSPEAYMSSVSENVSHPSLSLLSLLFDTIYIFILAEY